MYGKKVGMTRYYNAEGESVPVTVLEMVDNVVYQVKTPEKDGYSALQVGLDTQKAQRLNKPQTGHFAAAKKGAPKFVAEIRLDQDGQKQYGVDGVELNVGDVVSMDSIFEAGQKVDVSGTSVGKGFAGVIKRHGMKGAQTMTHGTHEYFRHGGSIGNRKFPGRVFKNKRMAGRMGGTTVLQEALEVVAVRQEDKAILIKGSIPGRKNTYVFVRKTLKS